MLKVGKKCFKGYNFPGVVYNSTVSVHSEIDAFAKLIRYLGYKKEKQRKKIEIDIVNYRFTKKALAMSRPCTQCCQTIKKLCRKFNIVISSFSYSTSDKWVKDTLENIHKDSIPSSGKRF
jgi:hypothetical protein